jgi:glycosyltransferase involved in cell wall biosynthesis
MYNGQNISVVIPCLNEERGLDSVLADMPHFIDEVIVVDNGSRDGSIKIAKKYNVKIIQETIKGYGRVLLKGIRNANGDIVVLLDGDGSYPICNIKEMYDFMKEGQLDFVSGCRFPLDNRYAMPLVNLLSNYFISWLVRMMFKIKLQDSQSGMMVFKKTIMEKIKIYNMGMGFSQEIKVKAWTNSIRCAEIHIPYKIRIGNVKFRKIKDGLKNLYDLLLLGLKLR